ncbi:MAG TPA: lysylphosphatidylglycerol synthase transmembrane domain-containing protein [bacterium]|nr:lysylphosphatidylglycerol synthase transmembrane domain-containing protein [bacterium]
MSARGRVVALSWVAGVVLLAVTAILALRHEQDPRALERLVDRSNPGWLGAAVVLQVGTYLADAAIWWRVLSRAETKRPFRSLVALGFAKLFVDQAVPTAGLSGTAVIVRGLGRRGIARDVALAGVSLDLISHYVAYLLALTAAIAVLIADGFAPASLLPAAVVLALAAVLVVGSIAVLLRRGVEALPRFLRRIPALVSLAEDFTLARGGVVRDRELLGECVLLQLAIFLFDAATVVVCLAAVGAAPRLSAVLASYMAASLARTVGIVPGGIGTFEAAQIFVLHQLGVPISAALAATALFRALSFWLPLTPGMVLARREAAGDREHSVTA